MVLPSFHPLPNPFICAQRNSCLWLHAACILYRLIKSVCVCVCFAVYTCKLADAEKPLFLRLVAGPDPDLLSFVLKEQQTGEVMVTLIITTFQLYWHLPGLCALSSPSSAIPKRDAAVAHFKTLNSNAQFFCVFIWFRSSEDLLIEADLP